jgi:hypothetical protein
VQLDEVIAQFLAAWTVLVQLVQLREEVAGSGAAR